MEEVKLLLNEKGQGHFFILEKKEQIGEMKVGISGDDLTVYHTEISPEYEGKGLAKKLLEAMVTYVRENELMVIALCPYVYAQFKRHHDQYADIWKNPPVAG